MSILQGLIPSHTTRHAIAAMERLPRRPVVVPRHAVIKPPRKRRVTLQDAAMDYLRKHPNASRRDVAAACKVSEGTVNSALAQLKRQGEIPNTKRHCEPTIEDRILETLRECNTGAPADLMARLDVNANTLYGALQRLKEKGSLSCKVTYTWTVHA